MLAVLSLTLSVLFSPSVHAGTYYWTTTDPNTGKVTAQSPTFTGGVVNIVTSVHAPGKSNTFPPTPFSTSNGHYKGSGNCESNSTIASNTPSSVKVNSPANPIVATFTWQATSPSDLPPPAVIVQQNCTATWSAGSYLGTGTASGTADCNLPGATVTTTTDSLGRNSGITSSGVQYTVVSAPGASFSIPASGSYKPTASTSATSGTSGDGSGSASVDYQVQVFPVVVNLIGTNNPAAGDYRALTGQQITASLGSPYGLPYGTKVTGYTWSLSGGTPIKGWDPNAPGDGQPTQILPLLPTDYFGLPPIGSSTVSVNPISFYDEIKDDTVTVKCAVTLSLPDYSTPTVNTASPQITFLKPTVTKWDVVTGYVQGVKDTQSGLYGLQLRPVPGSQQQGGEAWNNVTISVPPPFYGGQGCFVQLVTPGTTITNDNPTKSPVIPNNGQQGLDNSFPYRLYTWTLPNLGANADGPATLFSNYNATGYQGYNTVAVHDKFTTWVMYNPPAVGSQGTIWVPLQSYAWDWSFTVQWINNQWTETAASPMTAADDPHYQPTGVMNTPPQWSMIQTNSK